VQFALGQLAPKPSRGLFKRKTTRPVFKINWLPHWAGFFEEIHIGFTMHMEHAPACSCRKFPSKQFWRKNWVTEKNTAQPHMQLE
jgi:hypothetical protein